MRIYRGERGADGMVRAYVDEGGHRRVLPHLVLHSPQGFDYGYGGLGAMDLARSILADYLRALPEVWVYQAFKRRFLEPLDRRAPWMIDGDEIAAWLAEVASRDAPDGGR